jgi:hypothetical protein
MAQDNEVRKTSGCVLKGTTILIIVLYIILATLCDRVDRIEKIIKDKPIVTDTIYIDQSDQGDIANYIT